MKNLLIGFLVLGSISAKADFISTGINNSSDGFITAGGAFENSPIALSIIENLGATKTVKTYHNGHKKTRYTIRDQAQFPEQIYFEVAETTPEIISVTTTLKLANFDMLNKSQLSFRNAPAEILTEILIKAGGKVSAKLFNGFPSQPFIRKELKVDLDFFHCFAVGLSNQATDTNPRLTNFSCSLNP